MRSLAELLANYEGVTLVFVAPQHPTLALRDDLRQRLADRGVRFVEVDSLEEPIDGVPVIEQVDALYMTRIQKEHNNPDDEAAFAAIDFRTYKLSRELVARMKSYAPILHPFPRDQHFGEIPPEIDDDPRADVLPPGPQRHVDSRGAAWPRSSTSITRSRGSSTSEYSEWHDYNEAAAQP